MCGKEKWRERNRVRMRFRESQIGENGESESGRKKWREKE